MTHKQPLPTPCCCVNAARYESPRDDQPQSADLNHEKHLWSAAVMSMLMRQRVADSGKNLQASSELRIA
jgi:hypothetical protein